VTKEDLAGKTVGVATTTTHFNYASKTYTDSTIKGYPSSPEEQADLANGRLDAIQDDIVVLSQWLIRRTAHAARFSHAAATAVEIFGPEPASPFARAKLSSSTSSMRPSTPSGRWQYKEINDKYFKFDVYGGDS